MITPEQIEKKASKVFRSFLQAWLTDDVFFPLEYAVGKLPMQDYQALNANTKALVAASKTKQEMGYRIQFETRRTQKYGEQSLPEKILIETEADYLALIRRRTKFQHFQEDVGRIRAAFPELEAWLWHHPFAVINHAGKWDDILLVCRFLLDNPRPDLYMREIPLPIHTKFIEQHTPILRSLMDILLPADHVTSTERHFARRFGLRYDEPLVRFRLLDELHQAALGLPFRDMSVPISELAAWSFMPQVCLVIENKMNFLTLSSYRNTLAIWGGGFRVELLKYLPWLLTCPILYWGDLDAQGFQILATLRRHFPHTQSVLMDSATYNHFRAFAVTGNSTKISDLNLLNSEEYKLYQYLKDANLRLEQEHIPPLYATPYLHKAIQDAGIAYQDSIRK